MRNEAIARVERLRSTIVALLAGGAGPCTINDFLKFATVQELGPDYALMDRTIRNIHSREMLARIRVQRPDDPHSTYAYELPGKSASQPKAPAKKHDNVIPPTVQVDLIKATGRLRVMFNGLSIEIGVVQ